MTGRILGALAALALCGLAPAVGAQTAEPLPLSAFAEHPTFQTYVISPDGSKIAATLFVNGARAVTVIDTTTRKPVRTVGIGKDAEFQWLRWAGEKIVLVSVSRKIIFDSEETQMTRLIAVNVDTGDQWLVGARDMGLYGDDLLWVAPDGSRLLLSYQRSVYDWPEVFSVDLLDPKHKITPVQRQRPGIWDWYADNTGVIRMGSGWSDNKLKVIYRSSAAEPFKEVARLRESEAAEKWWDVGRIRAGSDDALILDTKDDGRVVLSTLNLATREPGPVIYRNESWDIDDASYDKDGNPTSVEFVDDRDRRVWLDPVMAKLQAQFEKALGADEVWITSTSRDNRNMLVYAGGENDPGAVYLYDSAKRSLDLLWESRPRLAVGALPKPKPIKYTARDGTPITAYLTLPAGREAKGLPLIIMPHGGPYGVRDKLTYDDDVQVLASRGYAVLQPNYRGSGGYGQEFENLGTGQIGRKMQDDLDDAMDWAVKEGIAAKERVCVVGASYGGYAAMWAVLRNPERYRCAASFAGVTDWKKILRYDAKFFSRYRSGKWKERVRGGEDVDLDQYAPVHTIARLERPMLVAQGKEDSVVPYSQYTALKSAAAKAGKTIEWLEFEEEGHGFAKPENRARYYTALIDFLARHNPPSP